VRLDEALPFLAAAAVFLLTGANGDGILAAWATAPSAACPFVGVGASNAVSSCGVAVTGFKVVISLKATKP
jgi:hypothetical protein